MSTNRIDDGLAFIFPGQGSQSVGMLLELANDHAEVESTFQVASEVLGYDLWDLVRNGPEERLNLTPCTQPAMLAADVAAWRVWSKQTPVKPGWMAGHSLGEYAALVCSDALVFEDAVRLVAERGRLMQEAVPPGTGAMAAILGLSDVQVVEVCNKASAGTEIVAPANFNAPGQIVIAGHKAAVMRALEFGKSQGAKKAVLLPVSVPSHCPLMRSAAKKFRGMLADTAVKTPGVIVLHNVDVTSHSAPEVIRAVLEKQLYSPVRWADSVVFMSQQGVTRFVECGPGRVLSGLNKRIVPACRTEAVFDPDSLAKALELI